MPQLPLDRRANRVRVVSDVHDVIGGEPSTLASADVDDRRAQIGALLDAGRGVANETRGGLHQRDELVGRNVGDEPHLLGRRLVVLAEVPDGLGHLPRAGVGIGPKPYCGQPEIADGAERRLEMLPVVGLGRDGVLNDHQKRLRHVDIVPDAIGVDALVAHDRVDARGELHVERAGVEHVLRVLAHREHPPLGIVIGHEMDVRELGDRVAHALVDAAADVAAFDVRDGLVQIRGGHRDGELLEAIAADHDHVRIESVEAVGEFERRQAGRFRHGDVIAAFDDVEHGRRDREAAGFDVVRDVAAVLVEENRSAQHQLELDGRMVVQRLDQQLAAPVVRAAGDRKTDAALPAAGDLAARGGKQRVHIKTTAEHA